MLPVDMQKVIDLAGNIPISNIDDGNVVIENYSTNNIAICTTNRLTNITHGIHFHDSYEFVICHADLPSAIIDNKICDRANNTLFAVNPMQEHGMAMDIRGFSLSSIHIDKTFMQNVSAEIYGSPNIFFTNDSFAVGHDISMLFRLLLEEIKYDQYGQDFMIENLSLLIAGNLVRQVKHNFPSRPHNIPEGNITGIKKVIDYMNENYTSGISCTEMANLVKMDRFGFIRSFKAHTSKTPYEYLLDLKIEKAKKMLMTYEYSITEISMMCGFSSHSHFTSTFKKKAGISPTEYRTNL